MHAESFVDPLPISPKCVGCTCFYVSVRSRLQCKQHILAGTCCYENPSALTSICTLWVCWWTLWISVAVVQTSFTVQQIALQKVTHRYGKSSRYISLGNLTSRIFKIFYTYSESAFFLSITRQCVYVPLEVLFYEAVPIRPLSIHSPFSTYLWSQFRSTLLQ